MSPTIPAVPTADGERIEVLDVLRGFALYGVLLANLVPWFSGCAFMSRAQLDQQTDALDQAFLFLLRVLCDGKAMMLLTLLFGLGFSLQLQRAEASGRTIIAIYLRRLAVLALIGVSHVLLLWWGDILWGYAVAGLGLILFRRVKGRKLLIWGLALALLPHLLSTIPQVSKALDLVAAKPVDFEAFKAQLLAALSGHDRRALTAMQLKQAYYHVGRFWGPFFPELLGRFLLGYWAGSIGLFRNTAERLPLFRKLAAVGLVAGLIGSSIAPVLRVLSRRHVVIAKGVALAVSVPSEIEVLLLTCGYAALVVLLMQRPVVRRLLLLIAPVGQMALTVYLMQSLICTFLFYGWGLGLITHVPPARLFPIAGVIFLSQILFAHAWLARFRFGPVEWLWRSLTYGRLQPLRRRSIVPELFLQT